ncbi:hypothetical protein QBC34DRAFT_496642 [Podospora aff. communis PSN243]|uniref:Uncharacterized protein n=1 Tax=Podospora aff. communis PSN243 TaxID=3040156 RepID=A0AAV9GHP1_9PEZI|nr:hypothetical protein QBC34DRAFT_496642 [Podospora aff. communis PSN243]
MWLAIAHRIHIELLLDIRKKMPDIEILPEIEGSCPQQHRQGRRRLLSSRQTPRVRNNIDKVAVDMDNTCPHMSFCPPTRKPVPPPIQVGGISVTLILCLRSPSHGRTYDVCRVPPEGGRLVGCFNFYLNRSFESLRKDRARLEGEKAKITDQITSSHSKNSIFTYLLASPSTRSLLGRLLPPRDSSSPHDQGRAETLRRQRELVGGSAASQSLPDVCNGDCRSPSQTSRVRARCQSPPHGGLLEPLRQARGWDPLTREDASTSGDDLPTSVQCLTKSTHSPLSSRWLLQLLLDSPPPLFAVVDELRRGILRSVVTVPGPDRVATAGARRSLRLRDKQVHPNGFLVPRSGCFNFYLIRDPYQTRPDVQPPNMHPLGSLNPRTPFGSIRENANEGHSLPRPLSRNSRTKWELDELFWKHAYLALMIRHENVDAGVVNISVILEILVIMSCLLDVARNTLPFGRELR